MGTSTPQLGFAQAITVLFRAFRAYTRARSPEERSRLEQEILAIFETLGASDTQSILEAREAFEEVKALATMGNTRIRTIDEDAWAFADSRIREFQTIPSNPRLTGPARNMLRIPFSEATRRTGKFNEEQADVSFNLIFESMRAQPTEEIEGDKKVRTSISVIRAFAKNFCHIPPFCSGKSE